MDQDHVDRKHPPMHDPAKPDARPRPDPRAAALRANLLRRKQQARGRQPHDGPDPAPDVREACAPSAACPEEP